MNNIIYSFIITTIAGLSTMFGYFFIYVKGDTNKVISFFLSFASGVMMIISLIDLLPSSFEYLKSYYILFRLMIISLFFILGIIISNFVNYTISKYENNNLKRVGFLSLISIILHNIPEGIITFMTSQIDWKLGLSLAIAIGFHNIPEGISIAIPLYYATERKFKVFFIVLIAGLSELIGGILTYLFLTRFINDNIMGIMLSLITGIMLNISLFNLLIEGINHNKKWAIIGYVNGILIMYLSHFLI